LATPEIKFVDRQILPPSQPHIIHKVINISPTGNIQISTKTPEIRSPPQYLYPQSQPQKQLKLPEPEYARMTFEGREIMPMPSPKQEHIIISHKYPKGVISLPSQPVPISYEIQRQEKKLSAIDTQIASIKQQKQNTLQQINKQIYEIKMLPYETINIKGKTLSKPEAIKRLESEKAQISSKFDETIRSLQNVKPKIRENISNLQSISSTPMFEVPEEIKSKVYIPKYSQIVYSPTGGIKGFTSPMFSEYKPAQSLSDVVSPLKKYGDKEFVLLPTSEGIKIMTPLQALGERFKQLWESATPEERKKIEKELAEKYYKPAERPKLYGSLVLGGIAHTLTGYGESKPARIEISELGETIPITAFSKRYNVKRGIGFIKSEQPSHLPKEEAVGSIVAEEFLSSFYSPKIKQEYYKGLDIFGKATEVVGGSGISAMSWPVTLPETVIEYTTKKDILPFTNFLQREYIGYGENAIGGGYVGGLTGEAIERIRRRNLNLGWQSEAMKVAASHPLEAIGATAGELFGLWMGGEAVHVGKVATIKGLGRTRQALQKTFDINLPGYTEIMYHMPHRYIRRWWVKRGTKSISDVMPIEFHSPETLTSGGLSFAKGETPLQRIRWTIEKTGETQQLKLSGKKYVLSASGSKRIGRTFMVKEKVLHELPAMSTTPYGYAPTRFYRFGPPRLEYSSSLTLFPRIKVPTGLVVRVKKIFQPPRGSYADVSTWAATQPKGSWGVIAPKMYMGGAEAEINIFGKTILKRFLPDTSNVTWLQRLKGYQYYTEVPLVGGKLTEYAPVVFTEPVHVGFPSGVRQILPKTGYTIRQIFSTSPSSELVSSTSLLNLNVLPLARISQPSVSRFQYPIYSILGLRPSIYTPLSDRYSSYNVPQYHPVDITSYTPSISSIPISTYDSMQSLYKSISTVYKYPYSLDRYKSNLYTTSYTAPYITPYYATPTTYYNIDNIYSRPYYRKEALSYKLPTKSFGISKDIYRLSTELVHPYIYYPSSDLYNIKVYTPKSYISKPYVSKSYIIPKSYVSKPYTPKYYNLSHYTSIPTSYYTPKSYLPSFYTSIPYISVPYTPSPITPTPYKPTPYTPTPYTPRPYTPTPYTPSPVIPPPYTSPPSPPPYTPPPYIRIPPPKIKKLKKKKKEVKKKKAYRYIPPRQRHFDIGFITDVEQFKPKFYKNITNNVLRGLKIWSATQRR